MTVVFVSNYFNHHQRPLSDALFALTGGEFTFVETAPMSRQRMALGYSREELPSYVKTAYLDDGTKEACMALIRQADAVIAGSAPECYLRQRIRAGKLTFRYSERPLKQGLQPLKYLPRLLRWHWRNPPGKPVYLLCAGGYVAADYRKFGLFRGKSYRWGYFPETRLYDVDELLAKKEPASILWAGRLLPWKHPEMAVEAARLLRDQGYHFRLSIIGTGEMEASLREMIRRSALEGQVCLMGAMPTEAVRAHMEKSAVFLCTSDRNEGWGAVVNEAMNAGCAVIVGREVGSAPYLIDHGKNGLTFPSGDIRALTARIKECLDAPSAAGMLGVQAYRTVLGEWNAEVAARRFLELARRLGQGEKAPCVCSEGPCAGEDMF